MRIGIDARMYSSHFTGIGRYVFELTENLFKLDQENEYILFLNDPEYSEFKPPNKRIHKVCVNARHYSVKEQTKFCKLLYKHNLDLVHFTHFNAPILYLKPSIVTIHDLTLSFFPGKKMNSFVYRAAYQAILKSTVSKAQKIIAVSKNTKKDLQKLLKTPSEKISVIYEGVNQEFKPITNKSQVNACLKKYHINKPFLLYTGVWRNHKNIVNLIKAFNLLNQNYKYNSQLVITGKEDPFYPEVKQTVLDLNLKDKVIFTDFVSEQDLVTLISSAHIYAFPSFYEGFGLPVLEAMQCHTPVACSNTSCLPEIAGSDNAVFFDPHSPQDIAKKLHTLATDQELRNKLINNGAQHIKNFSWQEMANQTLNLYKQILTS